MGLLQALSSGPPLLMDGAMGTELLRAGLRPSELAAEWNLTHPGQVLAVHRAYAAAGARVHLTNTFLANPSGPESCEAGVRLARQAAGPGGFVLGAVGPTVDLAGVLPALSEADGFLLETCSSPEALRLVEYALHRVHEAEGKPILLSLTYHRVKGRLVTLSGKGPETFARHAARHGVAALGVNCGKEVSPADVIEVVRRYREHTDLPLFARPNAGTPRGAGYPRGPEELAAAVPGLLAAGARMVGGCCGTTAAHIEAMGRALAGEASPSPAMG